MSLTRKTASVRAERATQQIPGRYLLGVVVSSKVRHRSSAVQLQGRAGARIHLSTVKQLVYGIRAIPADGAGRVH